MDSGIEERQNTVADRLGFEIRDHSMVLYGKCKRNPCPHRKKLPGQIRKVSDRGPSHS
jgi:Fe2+ or Zn2+ uptake regulation protein